MSTTVTTSGSMRTTGSERPLVRKLGVLAASLTLVLVSSLAFVLVTATPAAAETIDGGGTANPNVPKGEIPPGPHTRYIPKPTDNLWITYPDARGYEKMCAVKKDGRVSFSITVMWRHVTPEQYKTVTNGAEIGGQYYTWDHQTCNYEAPATETDVSCAQSVKITVNGPMSDPVTIFGPTTKMSAWSQTSTSRKDVTLCGTSVSQFAHVKLPKLGRYKMDVLEGLVPCKLYVYPGGKQPSEIKLCGSVTFVPKVFLAQQWCNGSSKDWSGSHSFTMDECGGPPPKFNGPWSCNVPSVTLDLRAAPHGVLDDGKVHNAKWQRTRVTGAGVRAAGLWKTQVTVKSGSSPSRGGPQDSKTQPYIAPSAVWMAGDQTTNRFQWFAASVAGSDWTLTRRVGFTAQFSTPSVTIESVNVLTGEMTVSSTTIWRAGSSTCDSAPLDVTVSRARNIR